MLGSSQWSLVNATLRTAAPSYGSWNRRAHSNSNNFAKVHQKIGLGHPNLQFQHAHFELAKKGPLVQLSDTQQVLFVSPVLENSFAVHVWTNHHSPQHHDITAEIVRAEPFNAATPLTNAAVVRHRLVMVERGQVPLLVKARHAQDAGALGIVVADLDGQCLVRPASVTLNTNAL